MDTHKMNNLLIADVPWHRLTTPYGRGTELPQLIPNGEYAAIADLIEHQGTLWQVTPWVLLFLLRNMHTRNSDDITLSELELYHAVVGALDMENAQEDSQKSVESLTMLLDEKYLWPADSDPEEDELEWEEEEARGYDPVAFWSYYDYSYRLLKKALPDFESLLQHHADSEIAEALSELVQELRKFQI
ncbi:MULTISPECIES: hypothetical protein [unclassified Paenibacillus]|uniref:hypothetical protein n=1 Tax=unclassified Paenibacillus TaxID=185978 RepID=UPI000491E812|nr:MULTISPECIES: hypothetical protein [unclassified Paenibacillus]SFR17865.1 hypothetical protein SAMN04488603_104441 [Paenibacillus sp. cl130]